MKVGTYYARRGVDGDDWLGFKGWSVWQLAEPRIYVRICIVTCGGRAQARAIADALNVYGGRP